MKKAVKKPASFSCTVEHIIGPRNSNAGGIRFVAEFRSLKQARVDELLAAASAGKLDEDAFLQDALAGWSGLSGGVNAEFVYDAANLNALRERYPGIGRSIVRAYAKAATGRAGVQTSGSRK